MKIALVVLALFTALCSKGLADETWQEALGRMPLPVGVTNLTRTNAISTMLNAFQSNGIVKALVFMPGAADDFVFYRRAHATLTNANPSLADAIVALTNETYIRADFRPPFLLLHTTEDTLGPVATIKSKSAFARLQARTIPGPLLFCDCLWDSFRPTLVGKLSVEVRPFANAPDSWHFWPVNFAACDLTQWELLQAAAYSGKTTFTLHWLTVDFQLDPRNGPVQDLKPIILFN